MVNPARAGMIQGGGGIALAAVGKPRASGDDPLRAVQDGETAP